jgi:hypothetical protein
MVRSRKRLYDKKEKEGLYKRIWYHLRFDVSAPRSDAAYGETAKRISEACAKRLRSF